MANLLEGLSDDYPLRIREIKIHEDLVSPLEQFLKKRVGSYVEYEIPYGFVDFDFKVILQFMPDAEMQFEYHYGFDGKPIGQKSHIIKGHIIQPKTF